MLPVLHDNDKNCELQEVPVMVGFEDPHFFLSHLKDRGGISLEIPF